MGGVWDGRCVGCEGCDDDGRVDCRVGDSECWVV